MADDSPGSPLERRVPGATGAGPAPSVRRTLPDALIARMQAAVDAAHGADGGARAAEPVTDPVPTSRAAMVTHDWPAAGSSNGSGRRGDAWSFRLGADGADGAGPGVTVPYEAGGLDDLAESYLVADPDLTAGYVDDADLADVGPDQRRPSLTITTSGWDALRSDAQPGADVSRERAARRDHVVQPGIEPTANAGQAPPSPHSRGRRRRAVAGVVLAVVLVAGGGVAIALAARGAGNHTVVHSSGRKTAGIKAAARLAADVASAAAWVDAQVSRSTEVACDPVTCQALVDRGFPGQRLDELGHGAVSPSGARIELDTPALRREFGASLAAKWAPAVLARFGLGADRITVRVIAPHGARAYLAALRAGQKQRQAAGASLLTSSQVTATHAARNALAAGRVDDRLLLAITALASQDPIRILAFGRTWPGTSAGVPLRTAYLSSADPVAFLARAAYTQAIIGLLRVQPPADRPAHFGLVRLAGRRVLSIWFAAPSPLGLISSNP